MTLEEFAVELAYLQELYEPCCQLSERMVQEWYAKLKRYNAPYLHEAIGEWMEANSYDPPVLKDVVRLTDVVTRRHQRQEAAEAQKQWEQEQAKVPVEERAAVLNTATRRLMVQQWPEYRQYWPDVAALEVDA